jgi:hypothetical protein
MSYDWFILLFSDAFSIAQVITAPNYRTTAIYELEKMWYEVVAAYFKLLA